MHQSLALSIAFSTHKVWVLGATILEFAKKFFLAGGALELPYIRICALPFLNTNDHPIHLRLERHVDVCLGRFRWVVGVGMIVPDDVFVGIAHGAHQIEAHLGVDFETVLTATLGFVLQDVGAGHHAGDGDDAVGFMASRQQAAAFVRIGGLCLGVDLVQLGRGQADHGVKGVWPFG